MIYDTDPYLSPYRGQIDRRYRELVIRKQELAGYGRRIADAVNNHLYYGVHADRKEVVFREWAPNATAMYVIGDFNGWQKNAKYRMNPVGGGNWELRLPAAEVPHGSLFKWIMEWNGGSGERLPAYAVRCVQDPETKIFSAQVWLPPRKYRWRHTRFVPHNRCPLIYEAHIGMSSEEEKVASFENIGGGDGRSFLGLTPDKGYIGASNGVFVFDIARMQVGGLVEGTGGGGLYSGQIGSMVQAGGKVFAAKQGVGVYVIDPQTDMLMDTLDFPTLYALTVATDGTVWGTLTPDDTGNGTSALLRIDPSTLATSEHPLPEGLELTGGWGAWRAGTFCAGVQSNVLYFMPGGRWASEGSRIVKYDIDADTFEEDFFTLPGQDLQYKQMFYGAGFRVDPRTNRLVCTATESGWLTHYQKNWVHFVDAETGELLETLRLDDYYWFPAMPVFPEAGGDAPTTGLMRPTLQVHAWPNPFIDYLVVRTEAAQRATLYDLAGKAVLTTKLQSGDNRIDTSTLPHGTYVLRCNGATAKVVK